ncbi:MAG: Nitrate reductase-like protein NarX [Chloroflexi bacterium]|nr:Nitrate reductase-like protein NarX [Chloroflexota bacterium]
MKTTYTLLAEALRYPYPEQIESLRGQLDALPNKAEIRSLSTFLEKLSSLTLADREELYTRTLDLNPVAAPYIGYQIWGESYKRGAFMAALNQEMKVHDIKMAGGELPDHLIPVLRYLAATADPMDALAKVMGQALKKMRKALKDTEKDNPYLHLLAAIEQSTKTLGG